MSTPQMPIEALMVREDACKRCPTPCANPQPKVRCASCPLTPRRWGPYGLCTSANFGLGDLVHAVANPIARAIDHVAGTKIEGCGGCAKRREALNKILPSVTGTPKSDDL